VNSLKPYWNEELERLRLTLVFWYDILISAGRSKTGTLQQIRLSCKAKYKLGIKNEYAKFEHNLLNEMQIRTLENLGKLGTLNQKK